MKKIIATVLCITYAAFGVAAHAAVSTYSPQVEDHATKAGFTSPERKAERAANRALSKKVRAALTSTRGLDVSNVTVLARKGAVTLAGTVPDDQQIALAENAAQGVEGVASVKNNLTPGYAGH
ncbi:BON domain-containing protein [Paraburkholderia sp. BL6669N2]|uniref:BON domain-containing protein n=1 Tax=Paraburkholderia sp. BL6669N2 TaxID=1938807 RepID=UPI000E26AF47|nr:BON domain-containing protein [Paraburkholderia sp. BL6669N2]REG49083.1 BON domain-containing protein [Paraburkholderia sp. BL6669N2]